ncbi:hypothetical protein [Pleionea sediminis]|uniref:hypothetical protein n=1 Tax=Pleionea sediminis TaxID=2569479 RepID=UPI0011865A72|nr:hypothetical protein [Pleionea sediminis]
MNKGESAIHNLNERELSEFNRYVQEHDHLLKQYFQYLESDEPVSKDLIEACVTRINELDRLIIQILRLK